MIDWIRLHWKLLLRRFRCIDMFCKQCGRDCWEFAAPNDTCWCAYEWTPFQPYACPWKPTLPDRRRERITDGREGVNPFLDCSCGGRIYKTYDAGLYVRRCARCRRVAKVPGVRLGPTPTESLVAMRQQGHSYRAIAAFYGMSYSAVWSRVTEARKKEQTA